MIGLGRDLAGDEELSADVCVVGAGPAGLTLGIELLGSGLKVLLLESGSAQPPAGGEPYGPVASSGIPAQLEVSRVRGLGGCALHWDVDTPAGGGPHVRLRELDEIDFEDRPGVRRPGWPFARSTLEPYYRRARELLGMQPAQAEDDEAVDGVAVRCLFSFAPARTFTDVLPSRLAVDPDSTILTDVIVTELHSAGPGTPVTSLNARTRQGRSFTVRARTYVLAAGGIENARLLLASRTRTPAGLGNEHDHVGRYFMAHPHYTSGVLVPQPNDLHRRPGSWDLTLRGLHPVQHQYALSEQVQRREGLLNISYWLEPRAAADLVPLTATGRTDAGGMSAVRHARRSVKTGSLGPSAAGDLLALTWAAPAMARFFLRQHLAQRAARADRASRWPLVFTLGAMAEQEPRPDSVVRLTGGTDRFGVPAAELVWRVGQSDAEAMRRTHDLLAPALARALGVRVTPLLTAGDLPGLGTGAHHMGTTRMSQRADEGVLDADTRVHSAPNLFLAGSSVFPAVGSANPSLTIIALCIRLADQLKRELRPPEMSV